VILNSYPSLALTFFVIDKRQTYKKRTTSERRLNKPTSGAYKSMNFDSEQSAHLKHTSKNNLSKIERPDYHSVKHTTTKMDKTTPRHTSKHYSRIENSTEKSKRGGLNTSKSSNYDKQTERHSSRKRDRGEKYKNKSEWAALRLVYRIRNFILTT
jgi:hypothetical protein